MSNYDGQEWGANGPTRITESIKDYCDNLNKILPSGTFCSRKSGSKITPCIKNNAIQFSILSPTFISLVHWHDMKSSDEYPHDNLRVISKFADMFEEDYYSIQMMSPLMD